MHSIIVVGAGPAGAVCALGLQRLGLPVTVVSKPRSFAAVEGTTARVMQSLHQGGLFQALDVIHQSCAREVVWNGQSSSQNHEYLLDRPLFDAALLAQLNAVGIPVIQQSVARIEPNQGGFAITLQSGKILLADFLVEARGRQASASGKGMRGPETVSLLNRWQGSPGPARTTIISLPDAWCWMARLPDGRCYWQLTLDIESSRLGNKDELIKYCAMRRNKCPVTRKFFAKMPAVTDVDLHARSSTATMSKDIVGDNWIRIGDAAMAVDPLSGNGIFQAMSSALQAPAVIRTLLARPEDRLLAQEFHRSRVQQLFLRFARLGRDFYAEETRWPDQPFWKKRSLWPDNKELHSATALEELKVATMAVVENNWITSRRVVTTPDQPLGMWHLQGIELAPFVERLKAYGLEQALVPYSVDEQHQLRSWLGTMLGDSSR